MRDAKLLKDGSSEVSVAIQRVTRDAERYQLHCSGMTVEQIAITENVDPEAIMTSIKRARSLHEAEQLIIHRNLKSKGAIENEQLRTRARKENTERILSSLAKLLEGTRVVPEIDKGSGKVTFREFTDPEVISMGLEHARKIISLDERPAQSQTFVSIQNNQQNNMGEGGLPSHVATTYEERLLRIRNAQAGRSQKEPEIIDVTPESSELTPAPIVSEMESQEWEKF